jgi:hypothetical protein
MVRPGRVIATAVATVALAVAATGCGEGGSTGGAPTPVDDTAASDPTSAPSTPATSDAPNPSTATATATAAPKPGSARQIIVVTHKFQNIPAVRAFAAAYPVYFKALVDKDTDALRTQFPAYFYADTEAQITIAKDAGWVMRPPASIVLRIVETLPDGKVKISSCRSQRTEYWNPRANKWVRSAPKGSPDVIIMALRGDSWVMYRWMTSPPPTFGCGGISYPA